LAFSAVAVSVAGQLAELVPDLGTPGLEKEIGVGLIVALGALNVAGVRLSALTSDVFAVVKIAVLAAFVVAGLFFVRAESFVPLAPHGYTSLGPAVLAAFFVLGGFEDCAVPAGHAAQARRHARLGTPHVAVLVTSAAAVFFALLLDFRTLVHFTSVIVIVQFLSTCLAVIVLRVRRPELPRIVRLPFGPAIPFVGAGLLVV